MNKLVEHGYAKIQKGEITSVWNKTGKRVYDTWLNNQFAKSGNTRRGLGSFSESGETLQYYVNEFERLKRQRIISGVDINKLTFNQLKSIVKKNANRISRKAIEKGDVCRDAFGDYELHIYKDVSDAKFIKKHNYGTDLCTKELKIAKNYLQRGIVYVITYKGRIMAQFHPETGQYHDKFNGSISFGDWQELRENIPFINQLINRMRIFRAMTADEIYSWIENHGSHIEGDLDLHGTQITKLPDSLKSVGGNLDLRGTQVTKLPDSLVSVGGYLDLYGTQITKFPDSLKNVGGSLNLRGIKIKKLPDSLEYVGGHLYLYEFQIEEIPKTLRIDNGIILWS